MSKLHALHGRRQETDKTDPEVVAEIGAAAKLAAENKISSIIIGYSTFDGETYTFRGGLSVEELAYVMACLQAAALAEMLENGEKV